MEPSQSAARSAAPDARSTASPFWDIVPNPRGGSVPSAERALKSAIEAFESAADAAAPLILAANALRAAGWASALRFAEALIFALPQATDSGENRALFGMALRDFRAAIVRHNLWEVACSYALFAHYQSLRAMLSDHPERAAAAIGLDELALAGRPVPPALLDPAFDQDELAHWRARYEQALLGVLRAHDAAQADAALDVFESCFAALTGPDPYDAWRLAGGVLKGLRTVGRACDPEAKRLYARFNMLLAEQARGAKVAPAAIARAAVALLWRGFALHGPAAGDADAIELLRDYGLSINWFSGPESAVRSLWDADATARLQALEPPLGLTAIPPETPGVAPSRQSLRGIGALRVHVLVYEDFLQTADAAISALTIYAAANPRPGKPDASAALQAGDAAYRLGAAASAVGLGGVATLADALGLAWRRVAHAAAGSATAVATNSRTLENGAEALRRMLHQVAAGIAPADPAAALADLITLIESDRRASGVLPAWH
jgi:hypothetical protein